jgi:hypothetical protein
MNVTLAQAANAIRTLGTSNTILLRGQPGIGKSAIFSQLKREMPDYHACYIDVANLDLGDLGMPVVDRERMVTEFAPSSRFGLARNQKKPVLLMLDELGKPSSKGILNMLLPVILERRLGDVQLPTGSIVFATTNLDTDGVGDMIPAHAYNRMTVVNVANPEADAWLNDWAMKNNVHPAVMAFVHEYPQVFNCYADHPDDKNPYNFNPLTGNTKTFASHRSMAHASHLVWSKDALGEAFLPLLAGTIGESAARDLDAMVNLADALPSRKTVAKDPTGTKLPEGTAARFLMAFSLAATADVDNLEAYMTYMGRVGEVSFEAYSLFVMSLASNDQKVGMACRSQAFTKACASLGKYF